MDGDRFDALTRAFGAGRSRRSLLKALSAAAVGAAGLGRFGEAAARGRSVGNSCRVNSDCASGLCVAESRTRKICHCASAADCPPPSASDICHQAACAANGSCGIGVAVGAPCDDGNPCTVGDVCQADASCAGSPKSCPVAEPKCQSAACDPVTGDCVVTNAPVGTSCADGNRCDGDEACDANGACASGTPVSCAQLDGPCVDGVCDPATGQCAAVARADGAACAGAVPGVCCDGQCGECCGDASTCDSAPEANMAASCAQAEGGAWLCGYHCVSADYKTCFNSSLALTEQCLNDAQQAVPCLICRLPVAAPCTDDGQCCGLCVDGNCEDGQPGSYCVDDGDCFSGHCDQQISACAAPIALGAACDPANDLCAAGTSCGHILGSNTDNFCCLALDATCAADEDCCQLGGVQQRCVLGTCKTRQGAGGDCGKNFDCQALLTCIGGICGGKPGVGGACDNDGNCAFDGVSNTQPVCSGGICRLPNGAACASNDVCAIGSCIDCQAGGHICGQCCTASADGVDQFFCGDPLENICCNHECIPFISDTRCGSCDLDCTCGGTEPNQYCARINDENGDDSSNPTCKGFTTNGHCTRPLTTTEFFTVYDVCSTDCPSSCTAEQNATDVYCFAQYTGAFTNTELASYCGETDALCIKDNANPCCNGTDQCVATCGASGSLFCFDDEYRCKAP